jgi:hypothetical protein
MKLAALIGTVIVLLIVADFGFNDGNGASAVTEAISRSINRIVD